MTASEQHVAWMKFWNRIFARYAKDHLIGEDERQRMSYKFTVIEGALDELNDVDFNKPIIAPDMSIAPRVNRVALRLEFFLSTLFMSMDQTPIWERLYKLSVVTCGAVEAVLYPFADETIGEYDALNMKMKTGATYLTYKMYHYRYEWMHFIQDMKARNIYTESDINALAKLRYGQKLVLESQELKDEVRLWVSFRFQPLGRTIRGIMNYNEMYEYQAKVNFPTPESLGIEVDRNNPENVKAVQNQYNEKIVEKRKERFEYVLLHAPYGGAVDHVDGNQVVYDFWALKIKQGQSRLADIKKILGEEAHRTYLDEQSRKDFEKSKGIIENQEKSLGRKLKDKEAQELLGKKAYILYARFGQWTKAVKDAQKVQKNNEPLKIEKIRDIVAANEYGQYENFFKQKMFRDDINFLLKRFAGFNIVYVHDEGKETKHSLLGYSQEKPEDEQKIIYAYPENQGGGYIVILQEITTFNSAFVGQGKPMAQNRFMKFVSGDVMQLMDMNQDMYLEETFKAPSLMGEFTRDEDVAIVGYPEDVYTDESSPAGAMHAFGDHTFVTIVQRVLDIFGVRYHYGHPDFVRATHFRQLGLFSHPWVNEDIMGAYKGTLYGVKVINREIMQAAKGRLYCYDCFVRIWYFYGLPQRIRVWAFRSVLVTSDHDDWIYSSGD